MSVQNVSAVLQMVIVNLGKDANGPWARPPKPEAVLRNGVGDTVRFQSSYPFTVDFKGATPFEWETRSGEEEDGLYAAHGTVRPDALEYGVMEKHFGYNLTVDGDTKDPDVVVKKDPRDP